MLKATTSKSLPAPSDTGFKLRVRPFKKLVTEQRTTIIDRRQDHRPATEQLGQPQLASRFVTKARVRAGAARPASGRNPTWLTTPPSVSCARAGAGIDADATRDRSKHTGTDRLSCVMASGPVWRPGSASGFVAARLGSGSALFSAGGATRQASPLGHDLDRPINRDMRDPGLAVDPSVSIQAAELVLLQLGQIDGGVGLKPRTGKRTGVIGKPGGASACRPFSSCEKSFMT